MNGTTVARVETDGVPAVGRETLAADRAPRPWRGGAYLLAAILCFSALFVATDWSDGYLTNYGTLLLSQGELAFKLHFLLFVLPATLLLAAAAAQFPAIGRRLLEAFDALGAGRRCWVLALAGALFVLLVSHWARVGLLRTVPVTDDENAYLFQAQLLASGQVYAEGLPAPIRRAFDNQFIVNGDRRYGMYFVGHPAVMALALKLGAIDWVGSIEAALTFLFALGIANRLYGLRTATLTGILLALSPFFILISATAMSQPTSALFLALVWYAAFRIEAAPRSVVWWVVVAGALGIAGLTRPQTAALLVLPALVRLTWLVCRRPLRPGWIGPSLFVTILFASAATFLWVNHATTGNMLQSSYTAYWQWSGRKWPVAYGPGWTLFAITQNLEQLNFWLFGWPLSLVFAPFFERSSRTWTLAAIPLVGIVGYGLLIGVPTLASVGPVYYAELIVPVVILSASGMERVITWSRTQLGEAFATRMLVAWPIALVLTCLAVFVPVQLASLRLMAEIARSPYDLVERHGLEQAIVFVHSLPALSGIRPGAWVYYHRNNSPDLSDRVLFVKDLGPEANRRLLAYLPDRRPFWMGMKDRQLVLAPIAR
jgi:hypothetical protein